MNKEYAKYLKSKMDESLDRRDGLREGVATLNNMARGGTLAGTWLNWINDYIEKGYVHAIVESESDANEFLQIIHIGMRSVFNIETISYDEFVKLSRDNKLDQLGL